MMRTLARFLSRKRISRRKFISLSGVAVGAALFHEPLFALLSPIDEIGNPLDYYPNRDWESIYRDQYRYDSSFTFVCSPNDTHACRVRAFVRNGVIVRTEQNYDIQNYADLYGNKATNNWNPRMCLKGIEEGYELPPPTEENVGEWREAYVSSRSCERKGKTLEPVPKPRMTPRKHGRATKTRRPLVEHCSVFPWDFVSPWCSMRFRDEL